MLVPLLQQPGRIAGDQLHLYHDFACWLPGWHNVRYVTVTLLPDGVAPNHAVPQRLRCHSIDNMHYP
jgi:hypothetical protein